MGSQKQYWVVLFLVLLLFFAMVGRSFAQDEIPPVEPIGLLGTPPSQPAQPPAKSSPPPPEVPDSTPVIEHPPENEPQPEVQMSNENAEPVEEIASPGEQPEPISTIDPPGEQTLFNVYQQQSLKIRKLDFGKSQKVLQIR